MGITNDLWVTNLYKGIASKEKKSRKTFLLEPIVQKTPLKNSQSQQNVGKIGYSAQKDLGSHSS